MQPMRMHRFHLVCQECEVEMQRSSREARSLRGSRKAIRVSRALRKSQIHSKRHVYHSTDQRYGARHPVGLCLTLNQPKGTGQQFRFIYDVVVMVVVAELVRSLVRERKERGCEG
ncbi:hypothetical protein ALC62_00263 [Cyphomyrmex costatus]|uniref:Uncharacterized protein n=1 Tax=Cyphomyrmex costatus TaxID=456900 RepID=A0A195D7H7_9HYME|nr:hypothetical protein ALC62_00263 [Cyphomyrmex costatus]